jgi:uncharacterized protein YlaI
MNILKLLRILNSSQKGTIETHKNEILNKCQVIARREYNEQQENKKVHDGMCPKCNNRIGIIDKFRFVQGKGSTEGKIIFGFGTIKGDVSIDTTAVNYCMECGNEWLKYKTKPISDTSILHVAFKYLKEAIENPDKKIPDWKQETLEIFNECCAEALNQLNAFSSTNIKLSTLRRYYWSVYDPNNTSKLEIL